MKKLISLIISLIIIFINSELVFATPIPEGTRVPVSFLSGINSDKHDVDDMITIRIAEDVYIDGKKVFEKDSIGTAQISNLVKSGSHGRGGFVEIKNASINDVDKNSYNVDLIIAKKGKSKRPSAVFFSLVGFCLTFIPFGLWVDGEPAFVNASTIFDAVITGNNSQSQI